MADSLKWVKIFSCEFFQDGCWMLHENNSLEYNSPHFVLKL